jgi:cell division protein FtsX
MVGVMFSMAFLVGLVAFFLFQSTQDHVTHDTPHLTLEVSAPHSQRDTLVDQMAHTLRSLPETSKFEMVPEETVQQTFTDFFEEPLEEVMGGPYAPLLMDVWLRKDGFQNAQQVAEKIRKRLPEVAVLVHHTLIQPARSWMDWMKWVLLGVTSLLLLGLGTVIAFAVRTGLSIHEPVLEVLDLMGASTPYIRRQFQLQTRQNTFKSLAVAGVLLGLSLLGGILFFDAAVLWRNFRGLGA